MNLSDLNVDVFLKYVRQVNEQMVHHDSMEKMLDSARDDLPIVEGLLRQYMLMLHAHSESGDDRVLAMAQRDLVVFLALWLMERERRVTTAFTRN